MPHQWREGGNKFTTLSKCDFWGSGGRIEPPWSHGKSTQICPLPKPVFFLTLSSWKGENSRPYVFTCNVCLQIPCPVGDHTKQGQGLFLLRPLCLFASLNVPQNKVWESLPPDPGICSFTTRIWFQLQTHSPAFLVADFMWQITHRSLPTI